MGVGERPRRFVLQHFTPGQGSHGACSCRDGRSGGPTGEPEEKRQSRSGATVARLLGEREQAGRAGTKGHGREGVAPPWTELRPRQRRRRAGRCGSPAYRRRLGVKPLEKMTAGGQGTVGLVLQRRWPLGDTRAIPGRYLQLSDAEGRPRLPTPIQRQRDTRQNCEKRVPPLRGGIAEIPIGDTKGATRELR